MKSQILFVFILVHTALYSQLNCKKTAGTEADTTTCYFAWKGISTKMYVEHNNPSIRQFVAFDSLGNISFQGFSGYKHGSNGLTIRYHENGAVASIQVTMQPDGGIQYTDITHFYGTNGKFLRSENHSLHETLPYFTEPITPVVPAKPELIPCNIKPQRTQYFLFKNANSFPIKITYSEQQRPQQLLHLRLKPGKEIVVDSCVSNDQLPTLLTRYSLLEIRKRNSEWVPFQLITAELAEQNKTVWIILATTEKTASKK